MKKEKVLVTGSKGFIGFHLVPELKKKYQVIHWDLKDGKDIRKLKTKDLKGVSYVIHLAAQSRVPLSIDRPLFTNDHNITGTLNLLKCSHEAGVKRFVSSSSASVYGEQKTLPLKEKMLPNPMSPYALQKLTGEHYCKIFSDIYGLETVSLRYFNVYGENFPMDGAYAMCIPTFIHKVKNNVPLTIMGGKQTRDFTYVKDVVRAIIGSLKSKKIKGGEVINIGSGKNYSINEIAGALTDNFKHKPQRKGEPMHAKADISRAKKLLNWSPKQDVIKWLRKQI